MLAALFDPFRTLATWLVSLLPAGSGELATGTAVMAGLMLVMLLIILPICVLGAWLEHRERRHP